MESMRKNPQTKLLVKAVLTLKDEDDCFRLLEDLCTINEVMALSQRMEVARLLRNHITYQEIAHRTGASTATISRVNRCLTYGADGYNRVLDRMEGEVGADGSV